jgi:large subunit ribosomal protein L7/L12
LALFLHKYFYYIISYFYYIMKKFLFIAVLAIGFAASASAQTISNTGTTTTTTAKTNYSLSITNIGTNKPAVIKALITQLKVTETEAHAMLNLVPGTIKTGLTKREANALKDALDAAGATTATKAN